MKFVYSRHARKRMGERDIEENDIDECIEIPDYSVSKSETTESHKKLEKGNLKVVWSRKDNFIKIITVMWK